MAKYHNTFTITSNYHKNLNNNITLVGAVICGY